MLRIVQAMAALLALAALAVAWPAAAQQEKTEAEGRAGRGDRPVVDAYFSRRLVESDYMLNRPVLGVSEGAQVGEVADVLVDPASGRVAYAVLARDEELGGERVVVPYEALRYSLEQRTFELAGGDFAVGLAPEYASGQGGAYSREQFEATYGRQLAKARELGREAAQVEPPVPEREAAAREGKGAQAGERKQAGQGQAAQGEADQAGPSPAEQEMERQAQARRQGRAGQQVSQQAGRQARSALPAGQPSQGLIEVARLSNRPVKDQEGREIGTLDTILIDPVEGGLRVAVIEERGFLGLGESIRAVPWSKVRFDWRERDLSLDMTSEEFAQAPQVDPTRRKVVFNQPSTGYEQFLFLEQQGRRAEESKDR